MKRRILKSCIAYLLLACMLTGLLPVTALAAEAESDPLIVLEEMIAASTEETENDESDGESTASDTLTYVSFGDSMTNGYGLKGYALPNGRGVNGFLQESPVAYPAMYADYLAEQTDKEVDLIQLAVSGMQVEDLTFILNYEWRKDWEDSYNESDSEYAVHRYRKMTYDEFMENYAKYGMGDYHTYDHFVDGKSSDLGGWDQFANSYFCAECGESFYGNIYNGKTYSNKTEITSGESEDSKVVFTMPDTCKHWDDLPDKRSWSDEKSIYKGFEENTEYSWTEVTLPKERGPIYFYHDETSGENMPLKSNMNGNIWFGNAMAAYAGQFQTAVKDADVISLGVGNANFGVYLLSRMISAMGVLTGFGADDYCWDKVNGKYDPTLIQNYEYAKLKAIIDEEDDPLMLAVCDLAEDIIKENIGTVVKDYMGEIDDQNISALENIMLYSIVSFMRSYGMMLDRIAELNPDAEVIIVGLMNAFSGTTMVMDDGTELNLDATFEKLFGLLNIYLTTLASLKHANDPAHENITYKYAEEATVKVLADVFYTEDEGIYSKDNVIRDRFIESVCNQVFYLMGDALVDENDKSVLPGGIGLVKVDRATVEAYEEFAEAWAEDKTTSLPDGMTTSQMFSSAVYLGFERSIVKAGQSGVLHMSAIKETSNGFDAVFGPIAGALGADLVTDADMAMISSMVTADVTAWAADPNNETTLQAVGAILATQGITDQSTIAMAAFAYSLGGENALEDVKGTLTDYGTYTYAPYFISANITDALYTAVMGEAGTPNTTFETLLNMFARMVIGDGLGQHPSKGGHQELFEAIAYEQTTALAHSQAALDGLTNAYVTSIKAVTEELMADSDKYEAATKGDYTVSADSRYLALSDGKLTGYEADLADELYGENTDLCSIIADDSLRADDLLWLLTDDAEGDAYFTDVVVPSLYDIAGDYDEDEDTDIDDVRAYMKAEVANADLITVSVGPSSMAFAADAAKLGIPTTEQWATYLGDYAPYAVKLFDTMGGFFEVGSTAAALLPMLEPLAYCNFANKVTYPALLDQIHALNPGAQVVALGYYDSIMSEETTPTMMGFKVPVGAIYSALNVEGDNIALEYAIENSTNTTYVKVRDDSGAVSGNVAELVLEALKIGHQHNLADSWSSDTTHHWHACTTPGCSGVYANIEGSGYGEHDFTENDYVCDTCGYVQVSPVIDTEKSSLTDAIYTVNMGNVTALEVIASAFEGGSLSYQWYSNSENSTEGGTPISTANSYTPAIDAIGTTYYYCEVTNTYEGETATVTTSVVKIEVIAEVHAETPQITTQPVSAGYRDTATDVAALTVEAGVSDGGTLRYQWYSNSENSTEGGTPIDGATANSYTPPLTEGTVYYYCVVTNTNNGEGITGETTAQTVSNIAQIIVEKGTNAATPVIRQRPKSATYVQGAAAEALTVTAGVSDGGTLSYQWYDSNGEISGATESSYTPDTSVVGTFEYWCVVTNTNENADIKSVSVKSETATIKVEKPVDAVEPTIVTQPVSPKGICALDADADQLFVEAKISDGGTLSYQWYCDGAAIDGATSRFYAPDTDEEGTFEYYCMVTNTNEAATGSTKVVSVITNSATVCVKDMESDMLSILNGVLALTNITDSGAGNDLDSTLSNLESEYAEQIEDTSSGTYYVGDSNVFLALGGTTAKADGTYVNITADSLENKGFDNNEVYFEFEIDNNAQTGLSALDMSTYITNNKTAIKNADIITYQVEASSFADYMLDSTKGTPSWPSKYSSEKALVKNYLSQLESAITAKLEDSMGSFVASVAGSKVEDIVLPMVERLMYAATVYFYETQECLAAIREYNPDALIVVVGLNNPVYGLDSLNISGSYLGVDINASFGFDFSSIFSKVIRASEMNTVLSALQDTTGNTIVVGIPEDGMIDGDLPKSIDVSDAMANPPLTEFKSKISAGMVVTSVGQESIAASIVNAVAVEKLSGGENEEEDPLAGFEAAFKAVSLTLTDNITINFKALVTEGNSSEYEVGALFWTTKPANDDYTVYGDPELVVDQKSGSYNHENTTDYHVFSFNDIAAKEMNDTIYAVVYVKSGDSYVYSDPLEYSVVKSAEKVLSSSSFGGEFKTLAVDMLNYGASAQEYFNYNTGALANSGLTNTQKKYGTSGDSVLTNGKVFYGEANEYVKFTSASLLLESAVSLNYKAEAYDKDGIAVESVVLLYSDNNETWTSKEMELNGDGVYVASIDEIVAKELRKPWYAKVCVTYEDGSVEESNTLKYSVEDFAYSARELGRTELMDVTNELIKYGDSAANYFKSID